MERTQQVRSARLLERSVLEAQALEHLRRAQGKEHHLRFPRLRLQHPCSELKPETNRRSCQDHGLQRASWQSSQASVVEVRALVINCSNSFRKDATTCNKRSIVAQEIMVPVSIFELTTLRVAWT